MKGIFFNISNHPSDKWTDEQREASRIYNRYGEVEEMDVEIIDIPFPQVPPEASVTDVMELASSIASKVVKGRSDLPATALVQGEMTLVYWVVKSLLATGIISVAATSERRVQELPDGSKRAEFSFVAYRPYDVF